MIERDGRGKEKGDTIRKREEKEDNFEKVISRDFKTFSVEY